MNCMILGLEDQGDSMAEMDDKIEWQKAITQALEYFKSKVINPIQEFK